MPITPRAMMSRNKSALSSNLVKGFDQVDEAHAVGSAANRAGVLGSGGLLPGCYICSFTWPCIEVGAVMLGLPSTNQVQPAQRSFLQSNRNASEPVS